MKRLPLILLILALTLAAAPVFAQEQTPEATPEPLPDCPVFEDQPADIRTSYYMGEGLAYFDADQLSAANFSFTCVIRVTDPDYLPAYISRAAVYTRLRDYEAASDDYTSAIELDSNLLAAYNNRGVVYAAMQEYDKAAADFDKVLDINPDYIPGYNNRSIIYAIQRDYDAAIVLLQDAIDRSGIDGLLADYRDPDRPADAEPIEFDPVEARAYALLGIVYSARSLDNFQNYIYLSNIAGRYPDERIQSAAGALESRFTFEMRLDDGTWMLVADFSPVSDRDTIMKRLIRLIAILLAGASPLLAQTEPECPQPAIENAAPSYYIGQGDVFFTRGQYGQAVLFYTCAIDAQPDYAPTYADRGFAYAALGASDSALDDYNRALELDEALVPAYINRGTLYTRLGNFGLALTDFDLAIGLSPNDAVAYNNRGVVHAAEGNYDLAIADFQQAIELDEAYATPHAALGAVYSALAAEQYQQFVAVSPLNYLPAGTPGEVLAAVDESLRSGSFAVWIPLLTPAA